LIPARVSSRPMVDWAVVGPMVMDKIRQYYAT